VPVFKGIWENANIKQLKMKVEYNEKPRGGAFRTNPVGCDNILYVNQNHQKTGAEQAVAKNQFLLYNDGGEVEKG